MANKNLDEDQFSALRKRAHLYFADPSGSDAQAAMAPEDLRQLIQELERQNEELRRAQEGLEQARQRYVDLYEFAPVAYLTIGATGLIEEANLAAAEMLGVAKQRLLGEPLSAFIVADDQDIFHDHRQKLLATREKQTYEMRLQQRDGALFAVQVENVIRPEVDGQSGRCRIMLIDISQLKLARKKIEDYFSFLEMAVRQRTTDLEEEKRKVEVASRVKSEFLAIMSHELRTPLNAIIGFTAMLSHGIGALSPDEQRDYCGVIEESSRHLLTMIQDMLHIAHLDPVTEPVVCRHLDLEALLQECLLARKGKEGKTKMVALFTKAEPVGIIWADAEKIREMVECLLDNAFKFTPDGGRVSISACRRQEKGATWLEIAVTDSGIGIDPWDFDRIFQPFEQVDSSSTREFGGIGMGLYKVQKIAGLLGGRIEVQSSPGQGSTFTLVRPLPEEPA
jgi:PAS domain S-box-containing protein